MERDEKCIFAIFVIIIIVSWLVSMVIHFNSDKELWITIPSVISFILLGIYWIIWLWSRTEEEKPPRDVKEGKE